jgi:Pentapeptide repeats (8 copies)
MGRLLVGAIAAVLLAVAIAWFLLVPAASWLAHYDVGSAKGSLHETALDDARGRLLTLGAGLFAGGALVFTALNFNFLRSTSAGTDQWQQRTHELAEQGQVTDRYSKAIEQLGSDKLDVRIGGIYALERVARDSARDHPTVMEVLAAFIREHSHEQWPLPEDDTDTALPGTTRPDVLAAVTVIGRRDTEHDLRSINLCRAHLPEADLSEAKLSGAILERVNLTDANLHGAGLRRADLRRANLTNADLTRAVLINSSLAQANLTRTVLISATLDGATLDGATLLGARWPEDARVPEGWYLNTGTGRLEKAGTAQITEN